MYCTHVQYLQYSSVTTNVHLILLVLEVQYCIWNVPAVSLPFFSWTSYAFYFSIRSVFFGNAKVVDIHISLTKTFPDIASEVVGLKPATREGLSCIAFTLVD